MNIRPSLPKHPHYGRWALILIGVIAGTGAIASQFMQWPLGSSSAAQVCAQVPTTDVTPRLENLGSPFTTGQYAKSQPYARNVWVMVPFQNQIYLGHGDSNANQGPIPLWFFNPSSNQFQFKFVAPEEEIRSFQTIDSELYTPGIDARESWDLGNIYRLQQQNWQKIRTLPGGVHVWSIAGFADQLWSVIRRSDNRGYLITSGDKGQTWQDIQTLNTSPAHMARFEESLYVFVGGRPWQLGPSLQPVQRQDLDRTTLFPNHPQATQVKKTAVFQSQLAYISKGSRYISHTSQAVRVLNSEDPHLQPPGLFIATSLASNNTQVQRVQLKPQEVPWDVITTPNGLFVLTSERQRNAGKLRFINRVRQANHPQHWCEILRFESDTFARSLTQYQNQWYFGLGTDYGAEYGLKSYTPTAHSLSGTILRTPSP